MKYGHFDDKNKEYVITRPDTPLPWINYLGYDDFFGIISNTGGGYCFYRDARLRRLTRYRYNNVPIDNNGRYLYIKDGDTVWNPTWKPMKVALDEYECRHGLGYSKIKGVKNGLVVTVNFFIPLGSTNEIWTVNIKNKMNVKKSIRLWSFIEWCLWDAYDDMTNFQRNLSIGEVEVEDQAIFHITGYRERRNHYAYFACSREISGFDTSRDEFVGIHNGLEAPQAVIEGKCHNSIAHGWSPIGVHQIDVELDPGQEENLFFILGYEENDPDKKFTSQNKLNKEKYYKIICYFKKDNAVEKSYRELKEYWAKLLANYQVFTGDVIVNRMVNIWNQYQCLVTFNMSRSASMYESGIGRGIGFRDSNQDISGFVHMIPKRARQRILDLASTQLCDGTCFHQYQSLTKKGNAEIGSGFNDDPLWLILSTTAYLKETGDFSILDEQVGYANSEDSKATLMDHLEISIQYTISNLGPHGLPLIGHADWNDCMNLNCFSTNPDESFQLTGDVNKGNIAESVMIAGLFCKACWEMIDLYNQLGEDKKIKDITTKAESMYQAIYDYGWDGEWFLRAYDASGNKIGSKENKEGKIFATSQAWCILGKAGLKNGYAEKALKSVKKYLANSNGIILQQPAYHTYFINLGEISSYPPGYKENAGIFTHNNTWIQIAETMVGHGDQAMEYYKNICPPTKEEQIEIYRSEPYVYGQMTAGPDAPTPGEGKNSWLTGTAAWSFVAISQYILGIQPDYKGLRINPCIPKNWEKFTVHRTFRGDKYIIDVINRNAISKGIKQIKVDGKSIDGNLVPCFGDEKEHFVQVIMGE